MKNKLSNQKVSQNRGNPLLNAVPACIGLPSNNKFLKFKKLSVDLERQINELIKKFEQSNNVTCLLSISYKRTKIKIGLMIDVDSLGSRPKKNIVLSNKKGVSAGRYEIRIVSAENNSKNFINSI